MKTFDLSRLTDQEIESLCRRPKMDFQSVFSVVDPIIREVESDGDQAIQRFTNQYDGVSPDPLVIRPAAQSVQLSDPVKEAIDKAFENICRFHEAQQSPTLTVETLEGVVCERVTRPIQRVGLYIPGGTAPLPSTALMLGIPAMLAGCRTIVLATPPDRDGTIPDSVLYVAKKIGATHLVKAGGAQAIAGLAFGTETIPKVDKIFGPGNQYVTAAKMVLQNSDAMVAIDMPAGPSEVLVIADEFADPAFVAADLLSQAEHGPDSQAVLVATRAMPLDALQSELQKQLEQLPRKQFAAEALSKSYIVVTENSNDAMRFSNLYAPEHLIINTADAEQLAEKVECAGSVFIGAWTPESMGDYASGTNHTLPTYGYARMYSGVSLHSFQKFITMQKITADGLLGLGPTVEILAGLEGLDGHKKAVSLRLKKLRGE